MKFGIFLPLQSPRPWHAQSDSRLIAEALEQAELADRLGFDYVWAQEHHFLEEYSHSSAPEVLLAAISQRTRSVRIGHGVMLMVPGYNHPARCAERIAMLDQVSCGRVEWGTGASGTHMELEGFGIDAADKQAMWDEGLRTAVRLLVEHPFTGVDGRYVKMPARNLVPKPVQQPHPPLWLACSNRAMLREAARLGMGALTYAFVDAAEAKCWVDEYYSVFEASCDPIGRVVNPNVAMLSNFFCHSDPTSARALGETGAEFFAYGLKHYFRDNAHLPGVTDLWRSFLESGEHPFVQSQRFDTAEQLAAHFRAFEQAGVDQIILLQQAGGYAHEAICASMERFAATALPEFKLRDEASQLAKRSRLAQAIQRAEHADARAAGRGERASRAFVAVHDALENARLSARGSRSDREPPPESLEQCRSLIDLLNYRAAERPLQRAVCGLDAQGERVHELSYGELAAAVEAAAAQIAAGVSPGGRVVVMGDTGVEVAIALLAAMRAGAVAVPVGHVQPDRAVDRSLSIVRACRPQLIVGASSALAALHQLERDQRHAPPPRLALDGWERAAGGAGPHRPVPELALIAYTSGSTQRPKGAPVSHTMALAALANTGAAFGFTSADRFLAILPIYHVLSLFVHCLSALRSGGCSYLLPPLAFAAEPMTWLRTISRHAITVSGAPNFAYARCAELPELDTSDVDLSSWRLAINGGEPPRASTLERFYQRWRARGFVRTAITPSYGLTEATGMVSGHAGGVGPRLLHVSEQSLRRGRLSQENADTALVSSGQVAASTRVAIVDPATHTRLDEGHIGEIWLAGQTIAPSYVDDSASEPKAERFAELLDEPGVRYMRTGDLGALFARELYVTGRASDMIIVRGENVCPEDVEAIARERFHDIGVSGAAAFGVEVDGSESVVLVLETPQGAADLPERAAAIRAAVARRLGVRIARLCWVPEGALPTTPSGKLRRADARHTLLDGGFEVLLDLDDLASEHAQIEDQLERMWRRALRRPVIARDQSLFELGGDSLLAADVLAQANTMFGGCVALTDVVSCFTIAELAARLRASAAEAPARPTESQAHAAPLAAFDGYEVRPLGPDHVAAATACLAAAFRRLPMVEALAPRAQEIEAFMSLSAQSAAGHGLSIALFRGGTQELIGCGLCDDYAEYLHTEPPELPRRLAAGLTIQAELDRRYVENAGAPTEPTLHMNMLALDRGYEGLGLPSRLVEVTLDLAHARGYRAAVVHAASPVVQSVLREQFGFTCVARQPYASYELDGAHPFACLPEPAAIMLLTRSLRDWTPRHLSVLAFVRDNGEAGRAEARAERSARAGAYAAG